MMLRLRVWLRALLQPTVVEREMHHEMQLHLDQAAERLIARGMSPEDARAAARCEFGNFTMIREEARDARGAR